MKFEEANKEIAENHRDLKQRMDTVQIQDSTFVTKMVEHEVILKIHESLSAGHQKLIEGHKELRNNSGNLSTRNGGSNFGDERKSLENQGRSY